MTPGTRVLLINDYGPESPRAGGAEVVVRKTQAGLQTRGVETSLFTILDVPGHRRTALSYLHNAKACRALADRLTTFSPSIVHLHNFYHELSPAILGTLEKWKKADVGRKVVLTAHDFHVVCPNSGLTFFRSGMPVTTSALECTRFGHLLSKRWDRRGAATSTLKLAQHVLAYRIRNLRDAVDLYLCPSAFMAEQLAACRLHTRVLSNIAPVPRPSEKTKDATLQLVFAGRLEPEKGLLQFLRAAPPEIPWMLDVIGEGEEAGACRQVGTQRGLDGRVHWLGRLPHSETMQQIARADVLVLPSVWPENQPLVLLEALAMRTSLLVSDLGGMREIVRESGVGETYNPHEASSLVQAFRALFAAKAAGTLHAFDAGNYLAARDETNYFDALLLAYGSTP